MASVVEGTKIVFGTNLHDDGAYDASLNTTISSNFSFGEIDGNVDYESDLGSSNCSSLFSSPDFRFKTPKKIIEEHKDDKDSDEDEEQLAKEDINSHVDDNDIGAKMKGPFYSPKDEFIASVAAKFSTSVGISSNAQGTKLLKKSAKKPGFIDENDNDTTRNIQNREFIPFTHDSRFDTARGPGAWFWGGGDGAEAGSEVNADIKVQSGSPMETSSFQFQQRDPSVSFSLGQTSTGTCSSRRKSEAGRSQTRWKEMETVSPSKIPPAPPSLAVNTEQVSDDKQTVFVPREHPSSSCTSTINQFRIQGKKLYEKEDYENALDAFSNCLAACPEDWSELPGVLGNRAATLMMLERYVEAIEDCNRAVKMNPNMLRLLDRKGRAQLKLGMLTDAEATFTSLVIATSNPMLSPSKINRDLKRDAENSKGQVTEALNLCKKMKGNDFKIDLDEVEKLLEICPQMRFAQNMNVKLLCAQQRWNDAKGYAEAVTLTAHESVQKMFAHLHTKYPLDVQSKLDWVDNNERSVVHVNSFSNIMLCMGSHMAQLYIGVIKNIDTNKDSQNDAMNAVVQILRKLMETVGHEKEWSWVKEECTIVQQLIDCTLAAEHKVSMKAYDDATKYYTEALKLNHDAYRWNARLYYDRALAYMQVEKYTEAVHDCHQSIARDAGNYVVILCRARANRALGNVIISTRDYRRYLSVKPTPPDFEAVDAEVDMMLEAADEESTHLPSTSTTSTVPINDDANSSQQFHRQFEEAVNMSMGDVSGDVFPGHVKFSMGTSSTSSSKRSNVKKNRDSNSNTAFTPKTETSSMENDDEVNFGSPTSDMELDEPMFVGSIPFSAPPGPPPFNAQDIRRPPMPPPPSQASESMSEAPLFSMGSVTPRKKKGASSASRTSPVEKKYQSSSSLSSSSTPECDFSVAEQFRIQGKKLYEKEDYENALDAFSNCLAACPEDWSELPGVLGNRAATLMMLERYVEAIEDCNRAVKMNPNMLRLLDRKGRAQLKLGMLTDAEATFKELLSSCKIAVRLDSQVQKDARIGVKQVEDSRKALDILKKWNSDNRHALDQVEQLLEICPHMRAAQILKAKFLCNLQKWDEAKTYIETVALGGHETLQRLSCHTRAAFPSPHQDRLIWKYSSLTKKSGHHIEIDRYAISNAMLCMGSDMARIYLTCLKNLSVCRNHSSEAMSILGQLLIILASTVSDWKWVKASANLLKESIDVKTSADEKFRNSSYSAAIALYSEALRKDPEAYRWNAVLYCNRAAAYMNIQKYTEAINDCHQSLARDKQYVKALLRRGRAHRASGNFNSAITDFQNYLSSQPLPQDASAVQMELDDTIQAHREANRPPPPPPQSSQQYHFHNPKFNANARNGGEYNPGPSSSSSSSSYSQNHGTKSSFRSFRDKNGPAGSGPSFPGSSQRPSQRHPFSTRSSYEGNVPPPPPNQHQYQQQQRGPQQQKQQQKSPPRPPPSGNPNDQDHYSQLGLSSAATDKEIKTAYRRLALKYHPDKNKDAGAEDIFKAISTAYAVLSDKEARRRYDLSRPLFHSSRR